MKTLKEIEEDIFNVNARLKCIQEDVARLQDKPEPEFKAGQWIVKKSTNELERIAEICDDKLYYDNGCYHFDWKGYIRPATPSEIESHLKKICDEKGLMKPGQKYRSPLGGEFVFNKYGHTKYWESYESLYNDGMAIYAKGKFAEIIPDKKKLPEIRHEYERFITDWGNYDGNLENFLNKYKFKD